MDGFRFNNALSCFPGSHEGIRNLEEWPATEKLGKCRLFESPEGASLRVDRAVHATSMSIADPPADGARSPAHAIHKLCSGVKQLTGGIAIGRHA